MITIVVEIEAGMLTEFRADLGNVRLLVLDRDVERGGDDPATLRESPDPLRESDLQTIAAILEAASEPATGLP